MNYYENQIENFKSQNLRIPSLVATLALAENFTDGWDACELAKLKTADDVKSCLDWEYLKESVAWEYADQDDVIKTILGIADEYAYPR